MEYLKRERLSVYSCNTFLISPYLFKCRSLGRDVYHPSTRKSYIPASLNRDEREAVPSFWTREAQASIEERVRRAPNLNRARNVVLFLGDGMSVPTLAAARALLGQRAGRTGEEAKLHFETFPTVGLSKVNEAYKR